MPTYKDPLNIDIFLINKTIQHLLKCERLNIELTSISMLTIALLAEYYPRGYDPPSSQYFVIDIVY